MGNLQGFNSEEHLTTEAFEVIPNGDYRMIAIESEVKKHDSGAVMLNFTFQILDGKYQNRKIWFRQCLRSKTGEENKVGNRMLASLMAACGKLRADDTADLHRIPFVGRVKSESDEYMGEERVSNTVVRFFKEGEETQSRSQSSPSDPFQQPQGQPQDQSQGQQQQVDAASADMWASNNRNNDEIPF